MKTKLPITFCRVIRFRIPVRAAPIAVAVRQHLCRRLPACSKHRSADSLSASGSEISNVKSEMVDATDHGPPTTDVP